MTTFSSPPIHVVPPPAPTPRWHRLLPRTRRRKAAVAAGVMVVLVAGVLGASYEATPGGTLWGVEKTMFPGHAQDVALTAVVNDLKAAQDILGSGQQPTPDQLTAARTSLNDAKQGLDYLSPSPQRTSLQNLYLQLTQQLLQYTPDSAQQLPALPTPPAEPQAADPGSGAQTPAVALTSATAPTWGYQDPAGSAAPVDQMSDTFVPPPPGVPDAPAADWSQPVDPPLTPNLQDLGYYDPSWGQLYGYNAGDWYNYDLGGYNQYGYDVVGFDRWGYDRWGYDRWGYDRWGYNWGGYNWSGYDRDGWDRGGRNEWDQRRDHPDDPRNQAWYDNHHPYEQYYQWKFRNDDPVYERTQWDQAHGFNPNQYQNWNMSRDWHDPRSRDWAPPATAVTAAHSITDVSAHVASPVVKLNVSLAQFISTDKATAASGSLMTDLARKPARDVAKDLDATAAKVAAVTPATPVPGIGTRVDNHQTPAAPPALTAVAPSAPPSKVPAGFTAPELAPVPMPAPQGKPQTAPSGRTAGSDLNNVPGATTVVPKDGSPNPVAVPKPVVVPPAEPKAATPSVPDAAPPSAAPLPRGAANPVPPKQISEPPATPAKQIPQESPQRQPAAEPPMKHAPVPEGPAPEAMAPPAPVRQAPVRQAPAPQEQAPVRQAPPPVHEAPPPPPAPRQAPEPQRGSSKCVGPMCPPA
ncbi:hypothetical protein [Mycolicibacterium sp. HS_4_1]